MVTVEEIECSLGGKHFLLSHAVLGVGLGVEASFGGGGCGLGRLSGGGLNFAHKIF